MKGLLPGIIAEHINRTFIWLLQPFSEPCNHFHGVHASGQQPENEHCAQEGQNLCWLGNQDSIILSHSFRFIDILSFRFFPSSKFRTTLTFKIVQKLSLKKGLGDWACEGALWTVCSLSGCGWSRVIKNYLNKITGNWISQSWGLGSLRHDACEEPVMGWACYSSWYWYW